MTDLVRTTFTGGPSGDWLNQFHIDRLLGGSAQDSVDTVHAFWNAAVNCFSIGITAHIDGSVEVQDPTTGKPTGIDTATGYNVTGNAVGDVLPYQTQGLIIWNTGVWIGGRQVRGKTYVPAPAESYNDAGGTPSAAYMSALAAAAATIVSPTICQPVIYSRKHQAGFPIVSATLSQHWAVMRTRR